MTILHHRAAVPHLLAIVSGGAGAGAAPVPGPGSDGGPLPRHATPAELAWEAAHPVAPPVLDRSPGAEPTGPVACPGEYAPMDGVILAWQGTAAQQAILRQMIRHITTTGAADAYVVFSSQAQQNTVVPTLVSAGADPARIRPVVAGLDSIWMRDYGPRYIYEGSCRAIVDHVYNRSFRAADNVFPVAFAAYKKHARYSLPLVHGGGNYHVGTDGLGHATRLIVNENPTRTEAQIVDLWRRFQNVRTTLYTPFPTAIDSTQHIDMWLQVVGDRAAVVSDWPFDAGSAQDAICDNAAASLAAAGWTVVRVPARTLAGATNAIHYTYTNVVICNELVLVPSYRRTEMVAVQAGQSGSHNDQALAAWREAAPGKVVVPIDCEDIVRLAGVMHCIVMHVPVHLGAPGLNGLAPTVHLQSPAGGAAIATGAAVDIRWISDDDKTLAGAGGVQSVDIHLSLDGGRTWPVAIATDTADDGSFVWTHGSRSSAEARVRVTARDADGNTGSDESGTNITLGGTPCDADFNRDALVTLGDVFEYLSAFFAGDPRADLDATPGVAMTDLFAFLSLYFPGC